MDFDANDLILIWQSVDYYQNGMTVDKSSDMYANLAKLKAKVEHRYKEVLE